MFNKFGLWPIYFIVFNSAYAMAMVPASEAIDAQENHTQKNVLELLPNEILIAIFSYLSLEDLSASFVNEEWLEVAKFKFAHFYQFQNIYHKYARCFSTDKSQKNAFSILKNLRRAQVKFESEGCSFEEKVALADKFIKRNNNAIRITLNTLTAHEEEFKKHPESFMQMALLRIWDNVPSCKELLLKDYNQPCVIMLAPFDSLVTFFSNELDFLVVCDLASELSERGFAGIVADEAKVKFFDENHWYYATELFEIAFENEQKLPVGYYVCAAEAYFELENWQRAAQLYEIALLIDPELPTYSYENAASVYYRLRKYQRAAELFLIAFERDPHMLADTCICAAQAHYYLENWPQVIQFYETAFTRDPTLGAVHYAHAAGAHIQLDNRQRALELYEIAFEKNSNLAASIYANAASFFSFELGRCKRAAQLFEMAFKKDPKLGACIYAEAAEVYFELGIWQRATELFNIMFEKNPRPSTLLYINAAYASAMLGDTERAASLFMHFVDNIDDIKLDFLPDTLGIMQSVFEKEGANKKYLEWVRERRIS